MSHNINKRQWRRLCTVTKNPYLARWYYLLFIRICDLRIWVWDGIVWNWSVDILFGTSIIDRKIWERFARKRIVISWHFSSFRTLSRNNSAAVQHHVGEPYWKVINLATISLATQTVFRTNARICISSNLLVIKLFLIEPTSHNSEVTTLHIKFGMYCPQANARISGDYFQFLSWTAL